MAAVIATVLGLAALVAPLGGPAGPRGAAAQDHDPLLDYLQAWAAANGQHVEVSGSQVRLTDPTGDVDGGSAPGVDVVAAGYYRLPEAPPASMLSTWLPCTNAMIYCAVAGSDEARYANGWWLFWMELAGPIQAGTGARTEYGVVMRQRDYPTAPLQAGSAFAGASHAFIGRNDRGNRDQLLFIFQNNAFAMFRAHSRSRWEGMYAYVAIPVQAEIQRDILGIDVYAYTSDGTQAGSRRDTLRGLGGTALAELQPPPTAVFRPGLAATPTPSPSPTPSPAPTASPTPTAGGSAASSPGSSPTPAAGATAGLGGGLLLPLVALVGGGLLILLGARWLLAGRGQRSGAAAPAAVAAPVGAAAPVVAMAVGSADPCPPLIAAARSALAACEEAIRGSEAAAADAHAAQAEVQAARDALDKARRAREAAERELEKRREPPDPGRRLGSSSFGGRDVHVDEYDLWLQEQARAAANAAYKAALDAATTEAERMQAHEDWMRELDDVDGPDGLDEVRRRDKEGRERWIREAEAALKAAQEAEAAAQEAADRAEQAATVARDAAAAAKAKADEACARAEAAAAAAADCIKLQTPIVPAADSPPPPAPPPPTPPPGPPPGPPPPPTPPSPPGSTPRPPTPPTRPRPGRPCPEGSEPRTTISGEIEVDLYLISGAQLKIDGNYLLGDDEAGDAIEGLETALAGSKFVVDMIGAVTDPVGSILSTAGVPSFDTVTSAPTDAAMKELNKLREVFRQKRRIGTWQLAVPLQHFRFSCRVTEACVDGQWVVTARDFVGERLGAPTYETSQPFEIQDLSEANRAWVMMSKPFIGRNAMAERQIAAAAAACGG